MEPTANKFWDSQLGQKKIDRKKLQGKNIMACPITYGAAITNLQLIENCTTNPQPIHN